jgi:broad specificity phosphatase PhoE
VALDLYLVRHGETAWTRTGQHTGRTDLPLLPEGEEQARRVGEALRGIQFTAAFSSGLGRALRTAELAGLTGPTGPTVTPLLREFDYGEYEGITSAEIERRHPGWQIYVDGCPGGETPEQVYARARMFFRLVDGLQGAVVAFTHGHFGRALAVAWTDLGIRAAARLVADTASIGVLRDGDRGRVIQVWNWQPELPGRR